MLIGLEKTECLKILKFLSVDNLVSLCDTVSRKVITVENKEEALRAIVFYSRTAPELLRRKKVHREHLYQYLAQEGHVEHPAADKSTLLKKVLEVWESRKQKGDLKDEKDVKCEEQSEVDSTESGAQGNNTKSSLQAVGTESDSKSSLQAVGTESDSQVSSTDSNAQVSSTESNSNVTVKPKLYDGDEVQLLALHFSSWFYQLLESISKCPSDNNTTVWGPQHFWQDAELTVQCNEPTGTQEATVKGAQLVSEKFFSMLIVDQLHFNPNISNDSVHGKKDPHGLTLVMVCGTVHRQKHYIGVFEQTFGLIRDPTEGNNWKIKFSKLILKASGSGSDNKLEEPA